MTEWLARPLGGLIAGLVVLALAVAGAVQLAGAIARPTSLDGLDACDRDFAAGCVTERNVLPVEIEHARDDVLDRAPTWLMIVQGDRPPGDGGEYLDVTVRNQPGRGELRAGGWLEAVFVGEDVIWLRLPSGELLETEDHPWYAVPFTGCMTLAATGGAVALMTGPLYLGRSGPRWYRRIQGWPPGLGLAAIGLGLLGSMVCFAYPRPAPVTLFPAGLLVLLVWLLVRSRLGLGPIGRHGRGMRGSGASRLRDRADEARLRAELRRLARADLADGDQRRNGHLAVVLSPATPVRRRLDHDTIAAIVAAALELRGPAGVSPDLTAAGWIRSRDGVRLTLGVAGDGTVDEDRFLEASVRDDGTVRLTCGRGATPGGPAGPPVVPVALVSALTQGALLLAGRLDPDRTHLRWAVAVRLDRLRGAVADRAGPPGSAAAALERADFEATTRVQGAALLEDSAAVTRQLLGPLWRELEVPESGAAEPA